MNFTNYNSTNNKNSTTTNNNTNNNANNNYPYNINPNLNLSPNQNYPINFTDKSIEIAKISLLTNEKEKLIKEYTLLEQKYKQIQKTNDVNIENLSILEVKRIQMKDMAENLLFDLPSLDKKRKSEYYNTNYIYKRFRDNIDTSNINNQTSNKYKYWKEIAIIDNEYIDFFLFNFCNICNVGNIEDFVMANFDKLYWNFINQFNNFILEKNKVYHKFLETLYKD